MMYVTAKESFRWSSVKKQSKEAYEKADLLRTEYCILVRGVVERRESVNDSIPHWTSGTDRKELKILLNLRPRPSTSRKISMLRSISV